MISATLVVKVERILNYLLVIALVILVGVLIKNFLIARGISATENQQISIGSRFPFLDEAEFSSADRWIIFAADPECGFSRNSVKFYERVHRSLSSRPRTRVLALFDRSSKNVEEFLAGSGLDSVEHREVDFEELGIHITPSIWVVTDLGMVTLALEGKLSDRQEAELFRRVQSFSSVDEGLYEYLVKEVKK